MISGKYYFNFQILPQDQSKLYSFSIPITKFFFEKTNVTDRARVHYMHTLLQIVSQGKKEVHYT